MIIKIPTEIIVELKKFSRPTKPKIKSKTISSDFKDRGFKNVDINENSKPSVLLDKKTL